jgi:hypothetical protein
MSLVDEQGRALDFVRARKRNYQLALSSPAGQEVLIDLARFCRANESCFHADARLHAVAEGRREVWLRIQQHLNLKPTELFNLFAGKQFQFPGEPDDERDNPTAG